MKTKIASLFQNEKQIAKRHPIQIPNRPPHSPRKQYWLRHRVYFSRTIRTICLSLGEKKTFLRELEKSFYICLLISTNNSAATVRNAEKVSSGGLKGVAADIPLQEVTPCCSERSVQPVWHMAGFPMSLPPLLCVDHLLCSSRWWKVCSEKEDAGSLIILQVIA